MLKFTKKSDHFNSQGVKHAGAKNSQRVNFLRAGLAVRARSRSHRLFLCAHDLQHLVVCGCRFEFAFLIG